MTDIVRFVPLVGTWDASAAWAYDPHSPLRRLFSAHGLEPYIAQDGSIFRWSATLAGLPFQGIDLWHRVAFELQRHLIGAAYQDLNIIAHSHGGQPPLILAARGFAIRTLTTIGTPVRPGDVPAVKAALHIGYWQHIHDTTRDWMATLRRRLPLGLGGIGDGAINTERRFLIPGVQNHGLEGISHSKVLRDPAYAGRWESEGWIDAIRTCGGKERACA